MFHLFAYADYYADGGMNDYVGAFATIDEAKAAFDDNYSYADIARVNEQGALVVVSHYTFTRGWLVPCSASTPA